MKPKKECNIKPSRLKIKEKGWLVLQTGFLKKRDEGQNQNKKT
jgi:hypothetical protein